MENKSTINSPEQSKQEQENRKAGKSKDPASGNYDRKLDGPNRPSV